MSAQRNETNDRDDQTRVCIVQPNPSSVSETFLRAHSERLPAKVSVMYGYPPRIEGDQPDSLFQKLARRLGRIVFQRSAREELTRATCAALARIKPSVVLAQYGPTGAQIYEACRRMHVPFVVHFHGFDASETNVLERHADDYRKMFESAASIIVVSEPMKANLISAGASIEKIRYNPYGVDCRAFEQTDPSQNGPVFLAVGRFVDKKAPDLTIRAFAAAHAKIQSARLRMIGDGPLLAKCKELANELQLGDSVMFLGAQKSDVVRAEMQKARAFVQHSVIAPNGDSEGLPVAILEAGACGLAVVSTRHAGIPESVLDGRTGLLVEEKDVNGMALAIEKLAADPSLAAKLGRAARERISSHFSVEKSIQGLWQILQSSLTPRDPSGSRADSEWTNGDRGSATKMQLETLL